MNRPPEQNNAEQLERVRQRIARLRSATRAYANADHNETEET